MIQLFLLAKLHLYHPSGSFKIESFILNCPSSHNPMAPLDLLEILWRRPKNTLQDSIEVVCGFFGDALSKSSHCINVSSK
jgi:hypothetical protein